MTAKADAGVLVASYLSLRRYIGILGLALPGVLFAGGLVLDDGLQPSLSAYYHTGMRDVFVGTLCAIGVFLLSYRGYERNDRIAGNLACVFAVGVAICPVARDGAHGTPVWVGRAHFGFAAAFFLTLVYFSMFLFTRMAPVPTPRKLVRNRVYRTCGIIMLACVVLIAALEIAGADALMRRYRLVFAFETAAILAFGVSWLVKGEAILGDRPRAGAATGSGALPGSPLGARHDER
jgi:hypothetical protein